MARRAIAGYLSRQIERLRASGMTRPQIARATGIGERTQRKLRSGETPGSRVIQKPTVRSYFRERIKPRPSPGGGIERSHYTIIVRLPDGSRQGVGVVLPAMGKHPTRYDLERISRSPKIRATIEAELQRQRHKSAPVTKAEAQAAVIDTNPLTGAPAIYETPHHRYSQIPWVTA